MPSLGADMEAGTLIEWRVKPGDAVKSGDIVAVVETQKGAIEIETFQAGVVEAFLIEPGRKVPVGTPMARIRGEGEAAGKPFAAPAASAPAAPAPPVTPVAPAVATLAPAKGRASPAARKRAAELGIDLAGVVGGAPDGTITLTDVERAAAAPAAPEDRTAAMRRAIGAAMSRAKRDIPHYYLSTTIDLSRALAWLETGNAGRPPPERILPAVLLLKATALALRNAPEFNGMWVDNGFRHSADIHPGVAVFLRGGGLVAPALRHADTKDLGTLMRELRDLVGRARSGGLRASELSDPTITVTNLGEQGVETVLPVIIPPQVAIVGFGAIVERPWAEAGAVAVRRVVAASLAADHRVSDGHRGALFLQAIGRSLQEPETL